MRLISGLIQFTFGFMILLLSILLGCTIIGLLVAFPVGSYGWIKMLKGMAQMGIGTYETTQKLRGK